MNPEMAEKIAAALLYEGYLLYPYRHSAVKNQRRFNFGVLAPRAWCEAQVAGTENWQMQTECLVSGNRNSVLDVRVRFLHLLERQTRGRNLQCWQEAVEREISMPDLQLRRLLARPLRVPVFFPASEQKEFVRDAGGRVSGMIVRRQEAIEGEIELQAEDCGSRIVPGRLFRVRARIINHTTMENAATQTRDEALPGSFVSAHTILAVRGGEFISLLDPPAELSGLVAGCRNIGAWPVLVGEAGERDLMLASPIILYDYPQIAPESQGDLFDGTEIDEILLLRIMTLTEDEKREMREADVRARQILERVEALPAEQMMKLHGVLRNPRLQPG